jgi:hypothetical protein
MAKDKSNVEESTEGFEFPNTGGEDGDTFLERIFRKRRDKSPRIDWGGGTA